MTGVVVVLGGAGRFGRASAQAFLDAGWEVRSLVRASAVGRIAPGSQAIEVDARDRESVVEAAQGCDVVVHGLNVRFTAWSAEVVELADTAIAAAERCGATLMFPGNLYNYGSPLPAIIDETTPMRPTSRKGAMRLEIERRMAQASARGVQTIILRAGDFFGAGSGAWLDRVILRDIARGRVTYPGPLGAAHAWAYVPDFASALVRLAGERRRLEQFASFGFSGHTLTGRELTDALTRILGRPLSVAAMPWRLLRLLSPIVPVFRELSEIAYLWREPHRIDGAKLTAILDPTVPTPLDAALSAAVDEAGLRTQFHSGMR